MEMIKKKIRKKIKIVINWAAKCPSATRERNLQKSFSQSSGRGFCVWTHTTETYLVKRSHVDVSTFPFCRCYSIFLFTDQ